MTVELIMTGCFNKNNTMKQQKLVKSPYFLTKMLKYRYERHPEAYCHHYGWERTLG